MRRIQMACSYHLKSFNESDNQSNPGVKLLTRDNITQEKVT
jgi:hypothetical protein